MDIETGTPPTIRGVDIPLNEVKQAWDFILEKGRKHLENTAFISGKPFTQNDLDALKNYYQEVLEYQESKFGKDDAVFNRSLREHLGLSEEIAKHMAPLLKIDSTTLQAIALTHDLGRMLSHRRGRNNAIEKTLINKLGLHKSFTDLLPPDTLWKDVDRESIDHRLKDITTTKNVMGAMELIDVFAKWEDKQAGRLRRWEDIIPKSKSAQHSPDKKTMWPSELKRQGKISSDKGIDSIATKYTFLKNWFEETSNMSIDNFVEKVEDSLKENPIPEVWVV